MTREEHIKQEAMRYADNPDIGVLESITAEHSFYDGAVYADQHPRKGLWDAEKVIKWIALHAELYGGFNQGKLNSMCEDLRKTMED